MMKQQDVGEKKSDTAHSTFCAHLEFPMFAFSFLLGSWCGTFFVLSVSRTLFVESPLNFRAHETIMRESMIVREMVKKHGVEMDGS